MRSTKNNREALLAVICLLTSALPWTVVFRYHFAHETSKDFRHFVPGLSLGLAWVLSGPYQREKTRIGMMMLGGLLVVMSVLETASGVYPSYRPGWEHLAVVDRLVPKKSLLIVNYQGFGPMVYTERPQIEAVYNAAQLKRALEDRISLLKKFDGIYLLLCEESCIDSPVR